MLTSDGKAYCRFEQRILHSVPESKQNALILVDNATITKINNSLMEFFSICGCNYSCANKCGCPIEPEVR
jgi:hypothetical protein